MATTAFIRPSHPAMALSFYPTTPTTPLTPTFPTLASGIKSPTTPTKTTNKAKAQPKPDLMNPKPQAPIVNYALLRSAHVSAIKYVISKLRWEQANNQFLQGESAWKEHNIMISRLEDELKLVQAGQKTLDQFPDFCHAPTAPLVSKPYGPPTKEQVEKAKIDAEIKEKELNEELEKNFPFIKQLFIGPMTKQQARNDRLLRKALKEGDLMDITELLPSANLRMAMENAGEKKVEKRRPYHEVRMERENAKIKLILEEEAARIAKSPATADEKKVKIGPVTQEEHIASLPVFGPKIRGEALLPIQREQRHVILNYLRKPWPQYDEEAAQLMEKLGRLAVKCLNKDAETKEKPEKEAKGCLE